jgi:hypothetical protein
MQKKWIVLLLGVCVLTIGTLRAAEKKTLVGKTQADLQAAVDNVTKGCEAELKTYCADVTPGEGRALACLYAREDKLSGQCEYALYEAANQLERLVAGLSHVASECGEDLQKYCGDVKPGEGRIIDCMRKNEKKLSKKCVRAVNDVKSK